MCCLISEIKNSFEIWISFKFWSFILIFENIHPPKLYTVSWLSPPEKPSGECKSLKNRSTFQNNNYTLVQMPLHKYYNTRNNESGVPGIPILLAQKDHLSKFVSKINGWWGIITREDSILFSCHLVGFYCICVECICKNKIICGSHHFLDRKEQWRRDLPSFSFPSFRVFAALPELFYFNF